MGVEDEVDFFNNAATLLGWAIQEKQQGHVIGSSHQDKFIEVRMNVLENVKSDRFNEKRV